MAPAIRNIVLGAGGLAVLVIGVALLWSGVHGVSFGPPPVINPPPGPLRVAPVNPGGLVVPEADETIMSGDDAGAAAQLAPATQAPAIGQLDEDAGMTPPAPPAAAPVVAPAAAAAPAAAVQGSGPQEVQLAATGDAAGAQSEWAALQKKMPGLLGAMKPVIVPAVVNGQSVWRVRVGGFADAAAGQAFCAQVVAAGGACRVVTP